MQEEDFHGNNIVAFLHSEEGERALLEAWHRERMQTIRVNYRMRVERDIQMRGHMSYCLCKTHSAFAEGLLCDICGHKQCAVYMFQLACRRTQE